MKAGSLFSGIGGLDLGLERAGMTVAWQSEIDPYACRVLAKHWPNVPNHGDIKLIDWSQVEPVDLIAGGYPCQPFSLAGVRRGDTDPRHLWPYFHRAIRHLRPRYALLENVPGHLSMGFDRVLGDLAEIGYDTEWCSIPAAAVGAPHLRWRIFAVAYPHGEGEPELTVDAVTRSGVMVPDTRDDGPQGNVADTGIVGRVGRSSVEGVGWDEAERSEAGGHAGDSGGARPIPPHTEGAGRPIGQIADVITTVPGPQRLGGQHDPERRRDNHWAVEPDVGRVAHGVDRLRCLGNAVVPQVAEHVGRMIIQAAA